MILLPRIDTFYTLLLKALFWSSNTVHLEMKTTFPLFFCNMPGRKALENLKDQNSTQLHQSPSHQAQCPSWRHLVHRKAPHTFTATILSHSSTSPSANLDKSSCQLLWLPQTGPTCGWERHRRRCSRGHRPPWETLSKWCRAGFELLQHPWYLLQPLRQRRLLGRSQIAVHAAFLWIWSENVVIGLWLINTPSHQDNLVLGNFACQLLGNRGT